MSKLDEIVKVAIHPAIGIARVGNSPTDHFFAPEVPCEPPSDPDRFRDPQGRIKRQAVRFRIYGLNERGEVVRELTAKDPGVEIAWKVHVANTKADWFQFEMAFDIPDSPAHDGLAEPEVRRGLAERPGQRDPLENLKLVQCRIHAPKV